MVGGQSYPSTVT